MSGTMGTDPCTGDGTCLGLPAEFVRLRYFFGQRLGVLDLSDEQSYLAGKQRFHNRRGHGAGVLCGLRAERHAFPQGEPPTDPTTLLRVRRGAALDACGREIVVGWDQCIDVAAWYAQHPLAHPVVAPGGTPPPSIRLWVALCYRECPSDPAPAPRDPCGCDAGGCEMARIREGFELRLLTDADAQTLVPAPAAPPAGTHPVPGEQLGGTLEDALALALGRISAADCPDPPADPCLLLARFDALISAAGDKVIDIAALANDIPERSSLLSTALLQRALVQVLAAAGDAGELGPGPRLGAVTFTGSGSDAGTLAIAIEIDGEDLARDPLTGTPPLLVKVLHYKTTDGTWEGAPAFTGTYVAGPPRRLELVFAGGLQDGERYRLAIANDPDEPLVDTRMRPLMPPRWCRHFRLIAGTGGTLFLADSLYS